MRRLVLLAAALLSFALPAVAQAAGGGTAANAGGVVTTNPFSVGVPDSSGATPTTSTTSTIATTGSETTSTAGSFGTVDIILVVGGVVLVIGGIVVFVGRDSRRTARRLGSTQTAGLGSGMGRPQGSKAAPKGRKALSSAEKKRRKRGRAPRRR